MKFLDPVLLRSSSCSSYKKSDDETFHQTLVSDSFGKVETSVFFPPSAKISLPSSRTGRERETARECRRASPPASRGRSTSRRAADRRGLVSFPAPPSMKCSSVRAHAPSAASKTSCPSTPLLLFARLTFSTGPLHPVSLRPTPRACSFMSTSKTSST